MVDSFFELRMNSLYTTLEEIEKEIHWSLEDIKKIYKDIDNTIGLSHR